MYNKNTTKFVVDRYLHIVYNESDKIRGEGKMSEKTINQIVGANLKRLIKQSKYRTQENFAYESGIDLRRLNRWLNGSISNIEDICYLADILEIDFRSLFEEV